MNALRPTDLDALLEPRTGPCVSIYLPTHRTGREQQQDRIRVKNLLRQAERELEGIAIPGSDAEAVLAPLRDRLPEGPFWENLSDGLAAFLAPGFSRIDRLPVSFSELVVVSGAFHLKRLLPIVSDDGRFHVLALSQKHVRLLQGTRFNVDEVEAEGLPKSLADALWMDDPEKSLQYHSGAPSPGSGRHAPVYHGHGAAADVAKTNLLRYFRRVDDGLREFLGDDRAPVVLAGVEHYFPIYREASKLPNLCEKGVPGSPDQSTPEELHARAWAIVEPIFRRDQESALARYERSTGKVTDRLGDIVPAAHHGRVGTLFVASGTQRWGAYIPDDGGSVILHDRYEQGDQDLLDVAAAATLRTGGRVWALPPEKIPGTSPVAALLRY